MKKAINRLCNKELTFAAIAAISKLKLKPMRRIFPVLCLLNVGHVILAQPALKDEEKKVMQVIFQLFDGMREADSAMVASVFLDGAKLFTASVNKAGEPELVREEVSKFVKSISSVQKNMLNEPIWDYDVKIDGNLAQVWTKYAFYYGTRFSHCGVDAFQLFKTKEGWKIFNLVDTRQREGCEVPAEVKTKFEKQ